MPTTNFTSDNNDGRIVKSDATYLTARNATSGDVLDTTDLDLFNELLTGDYRVARGFMFFDLSSIPTATITAASLSITISNKDTSTDDNVVVVSSTASDPLVVGDFDLVGTTAYNDTEPAYSTFSNNTPKSITLNSTAITDIQSAVGSTFKCALRARKDINATTPSTRSFMQIYTSEEATVAYRPILTLTYTLPLGSNPIMFNQPGFGLA